MRVVFFDGDHDASYLDELDWVVEVEVQGIAGGGLVLFTPRSEVLVDVVRGELHP